MTAYLDHNSATPVSPEVLEAMRPYLAESHGNPSSSHAPGRDAARGLDRARRALAGGLGAHPDELVFTGSGTEAVLTGVLGAARAPGAQGRHVVISAIEHAAGIHAGRILEEDGWEVCWLRPEPNGRIDPGAVQEALRPDTVLVSVLHANNETGVIQPIEAIAALCRDAEVLLHTDAVQSAGKLPLRPSPLGVDLLSLSGHKFGGPKGVGALWIRRGVRIEPLIPGSQEGGRRGGTVAVALVVGMAEAYGVAEHRRPSVESELRRLRDRLDTRVLKEIGGAALSGADVPRLSNTSHFTFPPEAGGDLVLALDLEGFAVSAGSACAAGSTDPSHVLLAMGMSPERARTAVRVSLGADTSTAQLDEFADGLDRVVTRARGGVAS